MKVREYCALIVENKLYRILNLVLAMFSAVRVAMNTPLLDPESTEQYILDTIYAICSVFYCAMIAMHLMAFGAFSHEKSYFKSSHFNTMRFFIAFVEVVSQLFKLSHPLINLIVSLRTL